MGTRSRAYVDTSALIAFASRSDSYHFLFRRLFSDPPSLVTTPLVVAEAHAWFLRRFDQRKALEFIALLERLSPLEIERVSAADQRVGFALLRRFSDQNLTLTDAVGLHLMERQKLEVCWSTDRHLALTGIPLVIHRY
ncbi:MAG: PIN domain-containing protein [Acidobacteriota bacterium]